MDKMKIPHHVAIIMDGNRRWAKERGLKSVLGYNAGADTLKKLALHILSEGTKYLSVFAFSTENFKRPADEVQFLMKKFVTAFHTDFAFVKKNQIKVVFSGRKDQLNDDVLEAMNGLEEKTKNFEKGVFNICLNYGGQSEIVDAAKKFAEDVKDGKVSIEALNEATFEHYLYQTLPPVDLLIRTSGEERISNFLLWQVSYAELYFAQVHFPDFGIEEYNKALEVYSSRDRKFGGDSK